MFPVRFYREWTYPTFILALSTRDFGRTSLDLASWLGVGGLCAKDVSGLPSIISDVIECDENVPLSVSVNMGDWLLRLHVPDGWSEK